MAIIVVGDEVERERLVALLRGAGFAGVEGRATVVLRDAAHAVPALLVVAGGADSAATAALCREARDVPLLGAVPILAVVAGADAAAVTMAGADDVVDPAESAEVLRARARNLVTMGQSRRTADMLDALQDAMLQIYAHSAVDDDDPDVLREMMLIAGDVLGFERTSLIAYVEGSQAAYVISATDDPTLSKFALNLSNYPEIRAALDSREPVLIDDVRRDPMTAAVAERLARTDVRAVAVFPLIWKDKPLGVLFYRRSRPGVADLDWRRLSFGRIVAKHVAARLRHGKVLEALREQTHRITRAHYEAERRLRSIDSLTEHFDAAADGVMVLDATGRILYVNRTAEGITGFARDGLLGADLGVIVPASHIDLVRQVITRVLDGHNLAAFDLELHTTSGEPITASVTTSTVISTSGGAILTFRDVTAQRALEAELRKTKEFLEKLVDSTVDGIVAADMRGGVIIFNQGAERIYGYAAEEVIGRLPVWRLYADGVARQIMRMLRSTQYGGVGRLEQIRREVLNKHGELVPVNMTASIIYEKGREVATVGIFSDLRDRIRIEQRLLQAQEKLQLTEKQALVAELAGTAAHELNQPLTSIIGYAQLIQRRSGADGPYARELAIIMGEAERMAEIVKKIGRITRYETKEYVGSTRVLDLEKASSLFAIGEGRDETFDEDTTTENFDDDTTAELDPDEVMVSAGELAATDSHALPAATETEDDH